ncbi:HAD hydrolase family protein [Faecalibacillus faecis]|nr:HAD hydrolase family protein [Faecalibacillus faecis]
MFIDVDETLLDYENKLPALADRAIKEAIKKEHCVYIYTGRSEAEVYDYI